VDQGELLLIRLHFGTVRLAVSAVYPSVVFLCTLFAVWAALASDSAVGRDFQPEIGRHR
jgi:hypothetical protein